MSDVFNPAEVCTWAKAIALGKRINASVEFQQAGIHILPRTQIMSASGIYIPVFVGNEDPVNGNEFFLHYRFSNGMEGMNAGLVREKFASFPLSPSYVLGQLLKEVEQGART